MQIGTFIKPSCDRDAKTGILFVIGRASRCGNETCSMQPNRTKVFRYKWCYSRDMSYTPAIGKARSDVTEFSDASTIDRRKPRSHSLNSSQPLEGNILGTCHSIGNASILDSTLVGHRAPFHPKKGRTPRSQTLHCLFELTPCCENLMSLRLGPPMGYVHFAPMIGLPDQYQ